MPLVAKTGKHNAKLIIDCPECGKQFVRYQSVVTKIETCCCSRECKAKHTERLARERHAFVCQNCGKLTTFHPPFSKKTRYCSPECSGEAKKTGTVKTCPVCQDEFYSNINRTTYCSNACRITAARRDLGKVVAVNCMQCGKLVYKTPKQAENADNSFCSHACRARFYQSGEKNSNWKGGVTDLRKRVRELAESKAWQLDVFKRDNYECQLCAAHGDINAHHAIPFAVLLNIVISNHGFDPSDKSQHDRIVSAARAFKPFWNVNNGITVCGKCHDMIHGLNRRKADGKQIPSATEASSV